MKKKKKAIIVIVSIAILLLLSLWFFDNPIKVKTLHWCLYNIPSNNSITEFICHELAESKRGIILLTSNIGNWYWSSTRNMLWHTRIQAIIESENYDNIIKEQLELFIDPEIEANPNKCFEANYIMYYRTKEKQYILNLFRILEEAKPITMKNYHTAREFLAVTTVMVLEENNYDDQIAIDIYNVISSNRHPDEIKMTYDEFSAFIDEHQIVN